MTDLELRALSGMGLAFCGLYLYARTLNRSQSHSTSEGVTIVLICVAVMLAGGYLIASAVYP